MDIKDLKQEIENNYNIELKNIEKVKNSYRLETKDKEYGIKIIKYEHSHFYFILSAINHLQERGFETIPEILRNKNNSQYIKIDNKFAYLTEWVPSRTSNYDNPLELKMVASKLGELHNCSKGFKISKDMKPRIGWYTWIKVFETRCNEILDFKNRILQKAYKSEFDCIYLGNIDKQINIANRAIEGLRENNYLNIMDKEVVNEGFCHHDFAHHNILVDDKGRLNIIDFDYCILDSHLHDLSSLLIRVMKDGKWAEEKANLIIDSYCESNNIYSQELKLMEQFIRFPQAFWQIGLQYYWEQQPWNEEFFVNKINKYLEDVDYREEFLEDYFK